MVVVDHQFGSLFAYEGKKRAKDTLSTCDHATLARYVLDKTIQEVDHR